MSIPPGNPGGIAVGNEYDGIAVGSEYNEIAVGNAYDIAMNMMCTIIV